MHLHLVDGCGSAPCTLTDHGCAVKQHVHYHHTFTAQQYGDRDESKLWQL